MWAAHDVKRKVGELTVRLLASWGADATQDWSAATKD